eukprot:TRINITY_DN16221_c0_g1_i1.p1 TRINITY_DN16221_c0_g1~~TRINITY_DN16221_c0_g1_i1.p1  ORF type:complete len:101 (-),score=11.37 TRINITY_DN16221_c0_g1_i1:481-783(-)
MNAVCAVGLPKRLFPFVPLFISSENRTKKAQKTPKNFLPFHYVIALCCAKILTRLLAGISAGSFVPFAKLTAALLVGDQPHASFPLTTLKEVPFAAASEL